MFPSEQKGAFTMPTDKELSKTDKNKASFNFDQKKIIKSNGLSHVFRKKQKLQNAVNMTVNMTMNPLAASLNGIRQVSICIHCQKNWQSAFIN